MRGHLHGDPQTLRGIETVGIQRERNRMLPLSGTRADAQGGPVGAARPAKHNSPRVLVCTRYQFVLVMVRAPGCCGGRPAVCLVLEGDDILAIRQRIWASSLGLLGKQVETSVDIEQRGEGITKVNQHL